MRYAATHDSLTGLMNRGETFDFLKRELARAERSRGPVSVILADVDHFKVMKAADWDIFMVTRL